MEIHIAVAKINQYTALDSSDTVEIIERPNGGISIVLAAGQGPRHTAKQVSTLVVRKVLSLLSEGVRDGAAACAASDTLYTEHRGHISAALAILSADLQTNTVLVSRNIPTPALVAHQETIQLLGEDSKSIGLGRDTHPTMNEIPLEAGLTVVVYTEGLSQAGERFGERMDIVASLQALLDSEEPTAQEIANSLLEHAIKLDRGHPGDDISVVVLRVSAFVGDRARQMSVRLPVGPDR